MQFICVVTASYTLGFFMTKNPWLVFRLKHEISKQTIFEFSIMEKMLIIQFRSIKKACHTNSYVRKKLVLLLSYTHFYSMKVYDRV